MQGHVTMYYSYYSLANEKLGLKMCLIFRVDIVGTNGQYIVAGGQQKGEVHIWNVTNSQNHANLQVFQGMCCNWHFVCLVFSGVYFLISDNFLPWKNKFIYTMDGANHATWLVWTSLWFKYRCTEQIPNVSTCVLW